jgi:hypothetical protein
MFHSDMPIPFTWDLCQIPTEITTVDSLICKHSYFYVIN